jgi:HAD superfamily hydrolase (TIGR01549 family)
MTRMIATASSSHVEPASTGLRNPCTPGERIQALLFDLDGTLYRQRPLRALMALDLLTLAVKRPMTAPRCWRGLRAYRRAQETLRARPTTTACTSRDQIALASVRSGIPTTEIEQFVDEWIFERPLKYLQHCRPQGLDTLLEFLDRQNVRMGIFSDYPAESKLAALGLAGRFSPVLCATDPGVSAFKPHPRGFLVACERWGLEPREVLVVGDRLDVDAAGAAAAGMPCVIVGTPVSGLERPGLMVLPSLERLRVALNDGR